MSPLDADPTVNSQKSGCDAEVIFRWLGAEGVLRKQKGAKGAAAGVAAGSHAERVAWRASQADALKLMRVCRLVQIEFHITFAPCPECDTWLQTTVKSDVKGLVDTVNRGRRKDQPSVVAPNIVVRSYADSAYGPAGVKNY
jgi:hypothetical protein